MSAREIIAKAIIVDRWVEKDADAEMIANLERLWAAVQGETRGCGKDDAGDWRQPKSIEDFEHAIYKHTPRLLALAKEAHATHAEAERLGALLDRAHADNEQLRAALQEQRDE